MFIFSVNNFSYETAVSTLASIFGPGAHPNFPNVTRLKGSGCNYDGFYPAGSEGGVDLEIEPDKTVSIVNNKMHGKIPNNIKYNQF